MATYYISTTGNDANNGSQASPWKTLSKALSSVSSGNTIHVTAGTYTESGSLNVPTGVSIEGEGASTTIIKSSVSGDWSTFLNLESGSVTNGGQTISSLTLDGQFVSESNKKTWIGIWATLRNNVVLKDCVIKNFYDRGVIFNGNGLNDSTIPKDPQIYCTGNKVLNCSFINTARNSAGYIAGQLNVSGQKDMEISGNVMDQTQRPAGLNGELIKYWGSGYNLGLKILNNTLKRLNFSSSQYNGSGDWNFAIELFNQSGLEIAGNNIQGSIDLNYNRVVAPHTYSVWIHDNVLDHVPFNQKEEQGIIFEFETAKAIVENNKFNNLAMGITFNVRTPNNNGGYNNPKPVGGYSATTDVTIKNNLFTNLYSAYSYGNCCSAAGIQFLTEGGTNDGYVRNLLVQNNTFVTKSGNAAISGLDLTNFTASTASTDGITIKNNIFVGFTGQYLEGGSNKMLNTVTTNNDIWQCGNGNAPSWSGSLSNTNNQSVNPQFDANYISPLGIGYMGSNTPPPSNQPPTVNAGTDKTLILPTNSVSLQGAATDVDGTIASYQWTKKSGPTGGTIVSPNSPTTLITDLIAGTYVYTLTATDDKGATGADDVIITVNTVTPPQNTPPVVDAGQDETISLSAILSGTATDDGSVVAYKWTKVSGPTGLVYSNQNAVTTTVTGLKIGTYVFRLTATDDKGLTGSDTKTLIIK